jgi:hypothetical protein
MLMMPGLAPNQLGLAHPSKVSIIQIDDRGATHSELIVNVPAWPDGAPVADARKP